VPSKNDVKLRRRSSQFNISLMTNVRDGAQQIHGRSHLAHAIHRHRNRLRPSVCPKGFIPFRLRSHWNHHSKEAHFHSINLRRPSMSKNWLASCQSHIGNHDFVRRALNLLLKRASQKVRFSISKH
jgi:hypothetical protein